MSGIWKKIDLTSTERLFLSGVVFESMPGGDLGGF